MDIKNHVLEDILDCVIEAGAERDRLEQRMESVKKSIRDSVPDSELYHGLQSHLFMLHEDYVCATQRLSRWLYALENVLIRALPVSTDYVGGATALTALTALTDANKGEQYDVAYEKKTS